MNNPFTLATEMFVNSNATTSMSKESAIQCKKRRYNTHELLTARNPRAIKLKEMLKP